MKLNRPIIDILIGMNVNLGLKVKKKKSKNA